MMLNIVATPLVDEEDYKTEVATHPKDIYYSRLIVS